MDFQLGNDFQKDKSWMDLFIDEGKEKGEQVETSGKFLIITKGTDCKCLSRIFVSYETQVKLLSEYVAFSFIF